MKKFLVALALFLLVTVSLLGLSGAARAVPARPAIVTPVTTSELGLGKGACFYDGLATGLSTNTKSCVGVAPPPDVNCNPASIQNSTLDVLHEVRDKVDIGGYASLYLFQSDAGGCGSVWAAVHIDAGCHAVSSINITDSFNGSIEGGLDSNGVLKCAPSWESTYMVDGESGSTATATATIDFQPQQSASVTV